MDDKSKSDDKSKATSGEPIWVICTSPVTPLLPKPGAKGQFAGGSMPAYTGLRFERGVNILAGRVSLGGKPTFVTLADLPHEIRSKPEAELITELTSMFERVRKEYPALFDAKRPTIVAAGTLKDLVAKHFTALRTAAENGTHRQSLEALVDHSDVPEDVKDLARKRLNAWRPAA